MRRSTFAALLGLWLLATGCQSLDVGVETAQPAPTEPPATTCCRRSCAN